MFYNKEAMDSYKRAQRKINFEKLGSMIAVVAGYYFGGLPIACIVGIVSIIYCLSEIEKLLHYQNFMKEKEIGLHDLDS